MHEVCTLRRRSEIRTGTRLSAQFTVLLILLVVCSAYSFELEHTGLYGLSRVKPFAQFQIHGRKPLVTLVTLAGQLPESSYVAICLTIREEGDNLVEFVRHHALIGVGKFYVMDNNSTAPHVNILAPYIQTGLVEYFLHSGHHESGYGLPRSSQGYAYEQCLRLGKGRHRFMAFIDVDEFIIIKENATACPSLPAFLAPFEQHAALGVNWVTFGSSGHASRPPGGALLSYTKCIPRDNAVNEHVKSIVNLNYTLGLSWNAHAFLYGGGKRSVNERGAAFEGPWSRPASWERIALHHYFTRSREEFRAKMWRGSSAGNRAKTLSAFERVERYATAECRDGLSMWARCCHDGTAPEVRRLLCGHQ